MKITHLMITLLIPLLQDVTSAADLTGAVRLDGSSTVFPISEAVAEEFQKKHPKVRVTVGLSGTGGGFKKFIAGETDLNNASRPIKDKELASASNQPFIEIPIAYDGLSVVVNPKSKINSLTVAELNKIWAPGPDGKGQVKTWKDINPAWDNQPIKLYGPGHDSGTFDYFTEIILGESGKSRSDYTASEDDNFLVTGVSGDQHALGYFGYSYYVENKDKLKVIAIDNGKGPIAPSMTTIENGTYVPLSRPLFIYVSKKAAERPEVQAFVEFYIESAKDLVTQVGYVPLPVEKYTAELERFKKRVVGSKYSSNEKTDVKQAH